MKVVVQRVKQASVDIEGERVADIGQGMLILLGIAPDDTPDDVAWLCRKCANLRIFDDANGVMNKHINEIGGQALIVSQFTLMASYKKGNRPSYIHAAPPHVAIPLYEAFCMQMRTLMGEKPDEKGEKVQTGRFGADMKVGLLNDGPVTICMDSKNPI